MIYSLFILSIPLSICLYLYLLIRKEEKIYKDYSNYTPSKQEIEDEKLRINYEKLKIGRYVDFYESEEFWKQERNKLENKGKSDLEIIFNN